MVETHYYYESDLQDAIRYLSGQSTDPKDTKVHLDAFLHTLPLDTTARETALLTRFQRLARLPQTGKWDDDGKTAAALQDTMSRDNPAAQTVDDNTGPRYDNAGILDKGQLDAMKDTIRKYSSESVGWDKLRTYLPEHVGPFKIDASIHDWNMNTIRSFQSAYNNEYHLTTRNIYRSGGIMWNMIGAQEDPMGKQALDITGNITDGSANAQWTIEAIKKAQIEFNRVEKVVPTQPQPLSQAKPPAHIAAALDAAGSQHPRLEAVAVTEPAGRSNLSGGKPGGGRGVA